MADKDQPNPETPADDPNAPIELDEASGQDPETPPTPARARVDGPGLLDDFDEDADLTSDPEVEQIVRGIPVEKPKRQEKPLRPPSAAIFSPEQTGPGVPLCESSAWKVPGIIGGLVTITAAVLAGVYAEQAVWAHVLITIYWALLHAGGGLAALVFTALMLGRRVGSFEGAASRMLLAVSLFLAVYSLQIPLTGGKLEEIVLAAAAYFGGLVVAFRLPPRDAAVVGGAHFGVAVLLWLGSLLSAVIAGAEAAG